MQVGTQSGDLGRMAALDAGYDITASGVTLDRFCGSGITTANMAVASVMAGMEDVVIAGGTEMMSSYKEKASKARLPFMDRGNLHLREDRQRAVSGKRVSVSVDLGGGRAIKKKN